MWRGHVHPRVRPPASLKAGATRRLPGGSQRERSSSFKRAEHPGTRRREKPLPPRPTSERVEYLRSGFDARRTDRQKPPQIEGPYARHMADLILGGALAISLAYLPCCSTVETTMAFPPFHPQNPGPRPAS